MELKEFVKATLEEIIQGVKEAQESTKDTGAVINPDSLSQGANGNLYMRIGGYSFATDVEINVAVTVQEKEGTKAGIGVLSGMFNFGTTDSKDTDNVAVSSIRVKIPVVLPTSAMPRNAGGRPTKGIPI